MSVSSFVLAAVMSPRSQAARISVSSRIAVLRRLHHAQW
jgi:hypothetical protein